MEARALRRSRERLPPHSVCVLDHAAFALKNPIDHRVDRLVSLWQYGDGLHQQLGVVRRTGAR
jgi:hypothetical protein